jgi:hypothetical protein
LCRGSFTGCWAYFEKKLGDFATPQVEKKFRLVDRQCGWQLRESHVGRPQPLVPAEIGEARAIRSSLCRKVLAVAFTNVTLYLKNIDEVCCEADCQRQCRSMGVEIGDLQALMEASFPKKAIALDVDDALRDRMRAGRRQRSVGEMGREQYVVLRHRRTEERREFFADTQNEPRQYSAVVAE